MKTLPFHSCCCSTALVSTVSTVSTAGEGRGEGSWLNYRIPDEGFSFFAWQLLKRQTMVLLPPGVGDSLVYE